MYGNDLICSNLKVSNKLGLFVTPSNVMAKNSTTFYKNCFSTPHALKIRKNYFPLKNAQYKALANTMMAWPLQTDKPENSKAIDKKPKGRKNVSQPSYNILYQNTYHAFSTSTPLPPKDKRLQNVCLSFPILDNMHRKILFKLDPNSFNFDVKLLHLCQVVGQLDQKFICLTVSHISSTTLYILDQHAAHERVLLENLMHFYYPRSFVEMRNDLTIELPYPLILQLEYEDKNVAMDQKKTFFRHGIHLSDAYANSSQQQYDVLVKRLPKSLFLTERDIVHHLKLLATSQKTKFTTNKMSFKEMISHNELNEMTEPIDVTKIKRRVSCLAQKLIQEITEELKTDGHYVRRIPKMIFETLCLKACHNAIRFNQSLSRAQCEGLVQSLKYCDIPTRCAHGRPSIIKVLDLPLVQIDKPCFSYGSSTAKKQKMSHKTQSSSQKLSIMRLKHNL